MSTEDFEQQKKSLFALINSWNEKNIKLATLIWQGNADLEEATRKEFIGLLNAKDYKSLSGLRLLANLNAMNSDTMDEQVKYIMNIHWLKISHANLDMFPQPYLRDLEKLRISSSGLVELPDSIGNLTQLKVLNLEGCRNLQRLPNSIQNLTYLEVFKLRGTALSDRYGQSILNGQLDIQTFFKKVLS